MSNEDTRRATDILNRFTDLGLAAKLPKGVAANLDRARALTDAAHEQADRTYSAVRTEVVAGLAAGKITAEQAHKRLTEAHATSDTANLTKQALLDAAAKAGKQAAADLAEAGEALVTGILAPEGDRLVAETTEALAALPEGVDSAEAAIAAGPKVAQAWGKIASCNVAWSRLRQLLNELRTQRIIEGSIADDFLWCRKPSGNHRLSQAIEAGAEPRIVTAAQADAEFRAWQAEQAAKAEAEQPTGKRRGPWNTPRVLPAEDMDQIVRQVQDTTVTHPETGQPAYATGNEPEPTIDLQKVVEGIAR